jgi:hypothetical protein
MDSLRVRHEDRLAYWRARAAKVGLYGEWTIWARGLASVALAAALVLASQAGLHGGFVALAGAALVASYAAARIYERRHRNVERAITFHESGLDRLDGGVGSPRFDGNDLLPAGHHWARQLDLTGPRSLFARLCSARTRIGASTLLDWLLHPSDPTTIASRRAAVEELRGRFDLREAWAMAGPAQLPHADPGAVAAWAHLPGQLPGPWLGPGHPRFQRANRPAARAPGAPVLQRSPPHLAGGALARGRRRLGAARPPGALLRSD